MANPLEMATPSFWSTVQNFDKIVDELGAPVRKLGDQFQLIGKVDTAKIKKIAHEVWGEDGSQVGIRADIANTLQSLEESRSKISEGWNGEAFRSFDATVDKAKRSLEEISDPLKTLSTALSDLATKFDETVGDIMTTLAGFGGLLSSLGGIIVALMAAPDPTGVTKLLGVVVAIVGAIVAAVAYAAAQIKAVEARQKAVEVLIHKCTLMMRTMKSN